MAEQGNLLRAATLTAELAERLEPGHAVVDLAGQPDADGQDAAGRSVAEPHADRSAAEQGRGLDERHRPPAAADRAVAAGVLARLRQPAPAAGSDDRQQRDRSGRRDHADDEPAQRAELGGQAQAAQRPAVGAARPVLDRGGRAADVRRAAQVAREPATRSGAAPAAGPSRRRRPPSPGRSRPRRRAGAAAAAHRPGATAASRAAPRAAPCPAPSPARTA